MPRPVEQVCLMGRFLLELKKRGDDLNRPNDHFGEA